MFEQVILNYMDAEIKKRIIELTLAAYRIVDKFPESEILKEKIKERAVDLAAGMTTCFHLSEYDEASYRNIMIDFEVLKAYLGIARSWNWVDSGNFDVLEGEYQKLIAAFRDTAPRLKQIKYLPEATREIARPVRAIPEISEKSDLSLRDREKAILDCFKINGVMRVGDLTNIFSGVNKRTLRRDIEKLCRIGALERIGKNADTAYKLHASQTGLLSVGQA